MYGQFDHLCRVYADLEGRGFLGSFRTGNGSHGSQQSSRNLRQDRDSPVVSTMTAPQQRTKARNTAKHSSRVVTQ